MKITPALLALGFIFLCQTTNTQTTRPTTQPRIVNLYNFVRNSDHRVPDSENVLFETTRQQVQLIAQHKLPATWALQYDALINPKYQQLLKEQLTSKDEIAAWWEIPRPLAEKAGLKWRGQHDWDSTANIGFSPGYTPDERRKLVDVYMADFKAVFGYYPRTVGSWYIDEVTLAYMHDKYGIVASCNCKDQVGTDGYTLWGGYWNQAYYPSKLNAYMPAQTAANQIDVPIFRMLGSDPIYQYGRANGISSLEPVYPRAGGSAEWVDWFFDQMIRGPSLAFAYTQAGQENSFGWDAMKKGLTYQVETLDKLSRSGEVRVESLADSGKWFVENHKLTPPTSVVCLDDWKHQDRKTVWYNSRFYRVNLLWEDNRLFIRDLHRFDESMASPTHDSVLQAKSLAYGTLPIMDESLWSTKQEKAGGFFNLGAPEGLPVINELNSGELSIKQSLHDGGSLTITCREAEIVLKAVNAAGRPLEWSLDLVGGEKQMAAMVSVSADKIDYQSAGTVYHLTLGKDGGSIAGVGRLIRVLPNLAGTIVLRLGDL